MKPLAEKIAEEHSLELVEVNIDNREDMAREYGVQGIPTLVLLDDGNNEISRLIGLQPQAKIASALGLN